MVKRVLVLSPLLAFAIGCGSGPKLVPVSGVVTFNGKPLGEAVIQFLPDPPTDHAHPADDVTDPEGNYQAETKGRYGAVPGKYRVVITKDTTPIPAAVSEQFKDDPFMAGLSSPPGWGEDVEEKGRRHEDRRSVQPGDSAGGGGIQLRRQGDLEGRRETGRRAVRASSGASPSGPVPARTHHPSASAGSRP